MKSRLNVIVAAAAVFAILCLDLAVAARQAAQGGQPGVGAGAGVQAGQQGGRGGGGRGGGRGAQANLPPAGPAPRLSNGKPDLSGLWANPYTPNMAGNKGANALDPKTNGDYAGSCLPFGMSRSINSPHGTQIIHHVDALAFLFEQNTWFHWVPTDPNFKWPVDLPPNWTGVSVGRWDGDTLVIETTGFNGYTRLDTNGHPHSSEVKMINTFTRTDSRTMTHTVTIHDPKTYTQDWMNVRTWRIKPYPDVIMEYSCEENNLGLEDGTITRWKYPENRN
ncbi:MAG: hypothetical protein HYU27_02010 [Acidobacteria bacterium]|nr:hypothetical protein [Acidobacteriota bacterium]